MRARRLLGLVAAASLLLVFSGCAAPTAAPAPAATGPVVSFYGDSYTRGTGASANDKRWSTIVSAERGWQEINRSENGLGFVNRRASMGPGLDDIPAQVIADDPDLVFVTMGLNDNFSYDRAADRIRETIDSDLERLRRACPTPASSSSSPSGTPRTARRRSTSSRGGSKTPPRGSAPTTSRGPATGSTVTTPIRPTAGWPPTACIRTTPGTRTWRSGWMPRSAPSTAAMTTGRVGSSTERPDRRGREQEQGQDADHVQNERGEDPARAEGSRRAPIRRWRRARGRP